MDFLDNLEESRIDEDQTGSEPASTASLQVRLLHSRSISSVVWQPSSTVLIDLL